VSVRRERAAEVAEDTRQKVVAAWRAFLPVEFVPVAAHVVQAGRERATALADLGVAQTLGVPTLGLVASDEWSRLVDALAGLAVLDEPEARLSRLAAGEPMSAWRAASSLALVRHGRTRTRVVSANACALCRSLAGPIPDEVETILDHPGCTCEVGVA
jgi:hypothetical protein